MKKKKIKFNACVFQVPNHLYQVLTVNYYQY